MQDIITRRFPCWNFLHNYFEAYNGRIWILWISAWQVSLLATSNQIISCSVEISSDKSLFNAIYGCNDGMDRRKLWSHLLTIHNYVQKEPWMLIGDFNVIADCNESSNSFDSFATNSDIRDFTDCRIHLSTFDHAYTSPLFTWTNKHSKDFIAKSLTKFLLMIYD